MNYVQSLSLALVLAPLLAMAGGNRPVGQGDEAPIPGSRERIVWEAVKWVGTTEATGRNDGAAVERILDAVGLRGTRSPYCAAFNTRVYIDAQVPGKWPRSAWSPDWGANPTWKQGRGLTPLPGDSWTIFFPSKNRIAHTGLVEEWKDSGVVLTIEANTSPDAAAGSAKDRDGDGVWRKRRLQRQIYSVRNWLN
jgi:hypothetical protein